MSRVILALSLAATVGAASATPSSDASSNALAFFEQSSAALKQQDLAAAGVAFFKAEVRAEADFHCFPPADDANDKGVLEVRDQNDALGADIHAKLQKDPKVLATVVSAVDAWEPTLPPGYTPGWHYKSQCADYKKPADDSKEFTLRPIRGFSRLLSIPEYFKAYSVFTDVYQQYDVPPPDDAYTPARVAAAADAMKTIVDIERSTGITVLGPALAYMQPHLVAFKVIKASATPESVTLPQQVPGGKLISGTGVVAVAGDAKAFDALWKSVLPAEPEPAIDFSSQLAILVVGGRQLAAAPMFINRVNDDSSAMMVFVRVPAADPACRFTQSLYPFVIAVIDRPAKLPLTAGYDMQNFPEHGC